MARTTKAWTPEACRVLARAYRAGGLKAAQLAFPSTPLGAIKAQVARLKEIDKDTTQNRTLKLYASLAPLAPEDEKESPWDHPKRVVKRQGEWKADIPAVRWVFDLGVSCSK